MAKPTTTPEFKLPADIDRFLHALSKLYALDGKVSLQTLVVNAKVRVQENWSSNTDWGETYYEHALHLIVPDTLFLKHIKQKEQIEQQIQADLNKLHRHAHESIGMVFLEMDAPSARADWRTESGLLLTRHEVPQQAVKRIWPDNKFRVFFSHKADVKQEVAELKTRLAPFGIASFVAHEDIKPTQEWRDEIENALESMDAFVALLTNNFHESDYTDQEVGYAYARGVPMVSVRLGRNPYGFIEKFQGLTCDWGSAHRELVPLFMKHERMVSAFIAALPSCESTDSANELAFALPAIESATERQVDEMVAAFNGNIQLGGSFGFKGTQPTVFGNGLVFHLDRLSDRSFWLTQDDTIVQVDDDIPF